MMYQAFKNNGNERNTTIAQLQPKMEKPMAPHFGGSWGWFTRLKDTAKAPPTT